MEEEHPVVRLVDDIARNFAHLPQQEAVQAVATHLRSFWDPRMRAQLQDIVAREPGRVGPVVQGAVAVLDRS